MTRRDSTADGTVSRRQVLAGLGAVGSTALAGCATLASGSAEYDVGMTAVAFDPPELTVAVGEEVVWHNTSSRGHTVTAYEGGLPEDAEYFASGGFESETAAREAWRAELGGKINSGESFRHTFTVPGEYPYVCIPHEQAGMMGTVVVEE